MEARIILRAAFGSHPGQIRTVNQDSVLAFVRPADKGDSALGLFIVADGMGGHKAGEIASQIAVDTIRNSLAWMLDAGDAETTMVASSPVAEEPPGGLGEFLERRLRLAIEEANFNIFEYAASNPDQAGNMGCTVTCAMVVDTLAVIANVGDSRTYWLSDGKLSQVTDDHSYVWQLAQEGHLSEAEIYDHPQRNVITRALGNKPSVPVDSWSYHLNRGDRLLLCSDGVWEMIRDQDEIRELLQSEKLESAVDGLIQAANDYGGTDNIGVVIVELGQEDRNGVAGPSSPLDGES